VIAPPFFVLVSFLEAFEKKGSNRTNATASIHQLAGFLIVLALQLVFVELLHNLIVAIMDS
jgi:hypothetical protein